MVFPLFIPPLSSPPQPPVIQTVHICLTLCIGGGGIQVIDGIKEKARSQRSVLTALKVS